MDHERRSRRQCLDLADRLLERADGVGIGWFFKPHMAVADLKETQSLHTLRLRGADNTRGMRHPTYDRPQDASSSPRHTFQDLASAGAIATRVIAIGFHNQSPCSRDWLTSARSANRAAYSRRLDNLIVQPHEIARSNIDIAADLHREW